MTTSRLLVNAPSGAQEVIDVGTGGGYFDVTRVLWDERIDGPLPAITLGGMLRSGNALVFDQARMDQSTAALAPALAAAALSTDADSTIKSDALIAAWKAKNWATFSADFDALTTANKLELLKRAAFATLKRVV